MAHDVFISYSTKDKLVADAVCATLEANKIRCWITPRDILPGKDWAESIEGAISRCKLLVLIFSSYSNNSKQVAREVSLSFNSDVIVIPFRIEDIEPKGAMKYYLLNTHWQDALTTPMENNIRKLVEIVSKFIGKEIDEAKEEFKISPDKSKEAKKQKLDEYEIPELAPATVLTGQGKKPKDLEIKKWFIKKQNKKKLAIILGAVGAVIIAVAITLLIKFPINKTEKLVETAEVEITTVAETTAIETSAAETTTVVEATSAAETAEATASAPDYNIGDTGPAGGLIFYINPNYETDGWRYLEAALSDIPVVGHNYIISWDYRDFEDLVEIGATATAIGTGMPNTQKIVDMLGEGNYAAKLCDDLMLNGYSDWFLPSKDELNLMYENLHLKGLGGFEHNRTDHNDYWSSSEFDENHAWYQLFGWGGQSELSKDGYIRVRAVRAFKVESAAVLPEQRNPPGMVSYWKFDEGSGNIAYDSVGTNHGTIYGATWANGIVNGALSFDGINDYVDVGTDSSLNLVNQLTIEAWVYFNVDAIDLSVFGSSSPNSVIRISFRSNAFGLSDNTSRVELHEQAMVPAGEWYHYVGTWDGETVNVYWDGVLKNSKSWSGTLPPASHNLIGMLSIALIYPGGGEKGWYMNGLIDELAIYNRALSLEEIQQRYTFVSDKR